MEILNHLAIPLCFIDDIQRFYVGILGFTEKYRFEIDRETAVQIFGISDEITVSVIERDGFSIELFHQTDLFHSGIMHICLNVPDLLEVCRQAEASGYPVVKIRRSSAAIAFITDRSGNRFEIKGKK